MATYDLTQGIPSKINTGDILNCPYSGTVITLPLPKGTFKLECWGAQGGSYSSYPGGYGGYSVGTIEFSDTITLYLVTGGQAVTSSTQRTAVAGGYNGGGNGYNRWYSSTYTYGQGGGGASDIRIGQNSLYARVIVAGGGGGSANVDASTTKYGGGETGGSPQSGFGGTQTSGGTATSYCTKGTFGQGANVTTSGSNYMNSSGGGGGGWYGGAACSTYKDSSTYDYSGYNGGGSGYIYTSATAGNYPSGCLLNSSYYLSEAQTIGGNQTITSPSGTSTTGNAGNGYIRITVIKATSYYFKNNQSAWTEGTKIYEKGESDWAETTTVPKSKYSKIILATPVASGSTHFIYDGVSHSVQSKQYLPNYMTAQNTSSMQPGSFQATYSLLDAISEWQDGATAAKTIDWRISLPIPTLVKNFYSYTGSAITVSWNNYLSQYMTLGGTYTATELGTYTATITPNQGLHWSDGTNETKSYTWQIVNAIEYTYTNLLTNSDMATDSTGWSFQSSASRTLVEDEYVFYLPGSSSNPVVRQYYYNMRDSISKPVAGHLYFGGATIKTEASWSSLDHRIEWQYNDTTAGDMVFDRIFDTSGSWQTTSSICTLDSPSGSSWQFRFFTYQPTKSVWLKKPFIFDLTNTFGAGNEPTVAWCQANMPWVRDSGTVLK